MKIKYNKEDKTYFFDDNKATELDIVETIKSNINLWKEKYFELEKNSIPISVIEKKIEELEEDDKYYIKANMLADSRATSRIIECLQEILDERNNTDEH